MPLDFNEEALLRHLALLEVLFFLFFCGVTGEKIVTSMTCQVEIISYKKTLTPKLKLFLVHGL